MLNIIPVVLAGGRGSRLWPLSRKNHPKQFLCLRGEESLLQQTIHRTQQLLCEQILVISNEQHYFLCQEQLQSFNDTNITYLLEPCIRNTAPAIAAASHYLLNKFDSNTVMLILPSDHWLDDTILWEQTVLSGCQYAAQEQAIVTFGITPSSPNTGYGYIKAGEVTHESHFYSKVSIHHLQEFAEKPSLEVATQFVKNGNYFWNSGMFACNVQIYLNELHKHAPDIYQSSQQAVLKATYHNDFIRLDQDTFVECRSESIDYAIMEKTNAAVIIPINIKWNDLGCWNAVAEANVLDDKQNMIHGNVITRHSNNCLLHNNTDMLVTTIGIQDQILVVTPDAILVANKQYSQQVKDLVDTLSVDHRQIIDENKRVLRPWGYYEILSEGAIFKVKRIMVNPGARLSLQMHEFRAEHWVVVSGHAEIINGQNKFNLSINQSTYIPKQTKHRLSNIGTEPLYIIEVQSGNYLGEDDIKRFDDLYQRTIITT